VKHAVPLCFVHCFTVGEEGPHSHSKELVQKVAEPSPAKTTSSSFDKPTVPTQRTVSLQRYL